ncbi:MAG: DUF1858 domain-containing protein, partial [Bulleidia sp.]
KTLVGDIVTNYPETAEVFYGIGMYCLGCPASQGDSVENACEIHGIDPKMVVTALNEKIAEFRG